MFGLGRDNVSLLEKVMATAKAPPERSEEELKAEEVSLSSARDSFFGVERLSTSQIEEAAKRLRSDRLFMGKGWKRLSMEPLKWTRGWGSYPVFALYSLDDNVMQMSNQGGISRPANLPSAIVKCYEPSYRGLGSYERTEHIFTTFQGVIPMEVRKRIAEAMKLFESRSEHNVPVTHIYLMAEATKWESGVAYTPKAVTNADPIVVGYDGLDLWWIDDFNLSSLEDYVIKEFPQLLAASEYLSLPAHK
jgi:hypothetical protein